MEWFAVAFTLISIAVVAYLWWRLWKDIDSFYKLSRESINDAIQASLEIEGQLRYLDMLLSTGEQSPEPATEPLPEAAKPRLVLMKAAPEPVWDAGMLEEALHE